MYLLDNPIKGYEWGSTTAIPHLLYVEPDGTPQAELWIGAHPSDPSQVVSLGPLDQVVATHPERFLGAGDTYRFGRRLPFLLKLLAAARPLSLQVHPDATAARMGFASEEAAGVPLDAWHRTYTDPFHKPEMVVALESFDALCGFRDPRRTAELLEGLDVPAVRPLASLLLLEPPSRALRAAFTWAVTLDRAVAADVVSALSLACDRPRGAEWSLEAATLATLAELYPSEPGVVAAVLLNCVRLEPGQALFLPPGNVHAYLCGVAVEIMASSNNVLRGGLTRKHVDVEGLLSVVDFTAVDVPLVSPTPVGPCGLRYAPPVDEFELTMFRRGLVGHALPAGRVRLLLALDGEYTLVSADAELGLPRGSSAVVPAADPVSVTGHGSLVLATTGEPLTTL